MQSDAPPAQGSSRRVEEEASPLATSKRRRRSKHSIKPSPLLLNSVSGPSGLAPPSTLTPSGRSPLKRGSSRESEMHRSSTPPEGSSSGAVKYTRTGRVSKAAKGQRVHDCDECGKVSRTHGIVSLSLSSSIQPRSRRTGLIRPICIDTCPFEYMQMCSFELISSPTSYSPNLCYRRRGQFRLTLISQTYTRAEHLR